MWTVRFPQVTINVKLHRKKNCASVVSIYDMIVKYLSINLFGMKDRSIDDGIEFG